MKINAAMNVKHIACPLDFSDASIKALDYAAMIARAYAAELHLVHVYERPYYSVAAPSGSGALTYSIDNERDAEMRSTVSQEFARVATEERVKDLVVHKTMLADLPAWKFYEQLDADKCDLIIMGTRGATGLLHGGLIGTNTERVIRKAPTPVISVPVEYHPREIRKILFATDFSDNLNSAFGEVATFAEKFGAEIIVGFINTRENFSTTKFANDQYNELRSHYQDVNMSLVVHSFHTVEEGIWELCTLYSIDLIAMLTHGRTGISHLIRGSLAEELSSTSFITLPLLTFKNAKK